MKFLFALLLALWPLAVQAHIVADPNKAISGAWFRTALRVGHGCDGKATTAITVTVPDDIYIIKPQAQPGWTIDIKKQALTQPVKGPHGDISEKITHITWRAGSRGGELPDDWFDEFGLSMKLPDSAKTLVFPTYQECGGSGRDWTDIPKPGQSAHDLKSPAPSVTLTPPDDAHHAHH